MTKKTAKKLQKTKPAKNKTCKKQQKTKPAKKISRVKQVPVKKQSPEEPKIIYDNQWVWLYNDGRKVPVTFEEFLRGNYTKKILSGIMENPFDRPASSQ